MYRQLCTYLLKKYGTDWLARLLEVQAHSWSLAFAAMI
jgi:hypothetical protein